MSGPWPTYGLTAVWLAIEPFLGEFYLRVLALCLPAFVAMVQAYFAAKLARRVSKPPGHGSKKKKRSRMPQDAF